MNLDARFTKPKSSKRPRARKAFFVCESRGPQSTRLLCSDGAFPRHHQAREGAHKERSQKRIALALQVLCTTAATETSSASPMIEMKSLGPTLL